MTQTAVAPSRVSRWAAPVGATAVLVSATAYTALANPYRAGFFPPCIFLAASGHYCPGCGGLRAVHELSRGDVPAALSMNPLVVLVVIPLILTLLIAWWRAAAAGRPAPRIPVSVAIAVPVLLGVFWILRNVPPLMPYLAP